MNDINNNVYWLVERRVRAQVARPVPELVKQQNWSRVWAQIGWHVWVPVWERVREPVREAVRHRSEPL
jgi:hypothetical protein